MFNLSENSLKKRGLEMPNFLLLTNNVPSNKRNVEIGLLS